MISWRRSYKFIIAALLHHQGSPIVNPALVLGIFHAAVAMVGGHRLEPLFEERNIFSTSDETHVRNRMNESLRILDSAFFHQIGPQLARQVELDMTCSALDMSTLPSARAGV